MPRTQISLFYKKSLLLLLISCFTTRAQVVGRLVEKSLLSKNRFTVTQFSTKEGLPQNQVREIISKKNGMLIIATTNGVVQFNGFEFELVTTDPAARRVNFYKLYWSDKYEMLTGVTTDGQFYSIAPKFELINPAAANKELIRNGYMRGDSVCLISRSGIIYTGYLPDFKMKEFPHKGIKNAECIRAVPPHIYMGSREGLFRMNMATGFTEKLESGMFVRLRDNPYNNMLYAVGIDKLYTVNNGTVQLVLNIESKDEEDVCENVTFMDKNNVFLASRKGLYWLNGAEVSRYTDDNGLLSHHIASVHYNAVEKCLFVGTEEKGFLKLLPKNIYSYAANDGFDISSLNSIIKTSDGKILVTETCCNIYEFVGDHARVYSNVKSSYASLAEVDGYICAGTWGAGIYLLRDGKKYGSITSPNLPDNSVRALFKDSKGNIWAGTANGVAYGKSLQTLRPFMTDTIRERIITIFERKNGNICFGGINGVFIINNGRLVTTLSGAHGMAGKEVRCFYEDDENRLWFGTYGGGMYCFDRNRLTSINAKKGCMLEKDVFCMAKDQYGFINMTSNNGLWRVAEKDLFDFYADGIKQLIPFKLDEESGIFNTEFNGGFQNNYLNPGDGFIYFPTIDGLVKVKPEMPGTRKLTPLIDFLYLNDTLAPQNINRFERSTSSIRFDFSCINYSNKYNVYFQYRLMGQRAYDWSIPQRSGTAYLKLLPPGTYTFAVRAIDAFNERDPHEASFEFEIKPYYYESGWFISVCVFVLIAGIYIIVSWRIRSQRMQTQLKEQYSRKLAEIELKAIQAQLNPHFLFNCMNTMKHFILEKNFARANESLNLISVLLRNTLENSDKLFVTLKENIKLLGNYIELEKMRLGDQLEYEIICDKELDPETRLPHLLIQPHVENAIKHGISHLETVKGFLKISFSKRGYYLVCTVTDNGIGRQASLKQNKNNKLHVSKGTQLTQEKASFLRSYNNYNCEIDIEDLYDEQQKPKGTRVTITIPLNHDSRNN